VRHRLIGLRCISAVHTLNNPAAPLFQQGNIRGPAWSAGMGSHSHTACCLHCCQHNLGRQTKVQVLNRPENKEVPAPGGIFHANKDTKAVFLDAFSEGVSSSHGVVIRNTDPIQPLEPGIVEDLLQGQLTARGERGMNMKIEMHARVFSILPGMSTRFPVRRELTFSR
jgi:hypothetical protein